MASASSVLKSMEENFFECSYCLENFSEPKQLPNCLHRYCSKCLDSLIKANQSKGKFDCPLCNTTCLIPSNGIDGFKTDFVMKSMLQFIQLQQAADDGEVKQCAGCDEEQHATAYCSRCNGFLCEKCHEFHQTSNMVRDHLDKVVVLKDDAVDSITMEKLASLKDAPRCSEHPDKLSELCCATCKNVPVCVLCGALGKHKGHDLHEVSEIASEERDKVSGCLEALTTRGAKILKEQEMLEAEQERVTKSMNAKKDKLKSKYDIETRKIEYRMRYIHNELDRRNEEINEVERNELAEVEKMREKKIEQAVQRINQEMDEQIVKKKKAHATTRASLQTKHGIDGRKLVECKQTLTKVFEDSKLSLDTQGGEILASLGAMVETSKYALSRVENIKSSASHVLECHNDWTDVQCLPGVREASDAIVDLQSSTNEIDKAGIAPIQMPSFDADRIALRNRQTINIDMGSGILRTPIQFDSIAVLDHNKIVCGGFISDTLSHVTFLDLSGSVLSHRLFRRKDGFRFKPHRYCCALTNDLVLTVTPPNLIGTLGSTSRYNRVESDWPVGKWMTCVASHPLNDDVFVGCNSRDIYIFDKDLSNRRRIRLPKVIRWPSDVAVNESGMLLVCDQEGGETFELSVNKTAIQVVRKLDKPDKELLPLSVCTDSNRFVYVLWGKSQPKCVLAQYGQTGTGILTSQEIDADSRALTSVLTDDVEKLVFVTETTRKLLMFDLVVTEDD